MKRLAYHLCFAVAFANAVIAGYVLGTGNWIGVSNFAAVVGAGSVGVWSYRRNYGSNRRAETDRQSAQASASTRLALNAAVTAAHLPTARAAHARAGTGSLETVEQEEPIRAWRGVRVALDPSNGRAELHAINISFGSFDAGEEKAVCRASWRYTGGLHNSSANPLYDYPLHDAPALDCSCGFYAVKDPVDIGQPSVLAEVDLYGTVIEHELGYRAEYQRVLSLRIPTGICLLCGMPTGVGVTNDQMYLDAVRRYHAQPCWAAQSPPERIELPPSKPLSPTASVVCDRCLGASSLGPIGPLDLAAKLGCEVRWEGHHDPHL